MLLNYHPSPTFIYVICLQWSDIVADSISLNTYKVVLLSIGNKLRNSYNTTLKPHPATPTSWPDHFESGRATPVSGHVGSCGQSLHLVWSLGMTLELPFLQPEPHSYALIPTPLFLQQVAAMMCTYGECRNLVSVWLSEYCVCSLLKSCQALLVHVGPW